VWIKTTSYIIIIVIIIHIIINWFIIGCAASKGKYVVNIQTENRFNIM
jgi:hypothetical protein